MAEAKAPAGRLRIAVWVCAGPGAVREWTGELAAGARVIDALRASGWEDSESGWVAGVWGRVVPVVQELRETPHGVGGRLAVSGAGWCRSFRGCAKATGWKFTVGSR